MASAQYTLSWEGEPLGDTVIIAGEPSDAELTFHAILTNNGDDTDTIKIKRRLVYLQEGVSHYFCWSLCFQPSLDSIFVTGTTIILEPGASIADYEFSGHYEPNGLIGVSYVEYTFFNQSNEDENLVVLAMYTTSPEGILDQMMKSGYISELYPNPSSFVVNIDYRLTPQVTQASLRVTNLLGATIRNEEIQKSSNTIQLDISDLTKGVYFYSVIINNEVYKTKKLIVR